MNGLTLAYIGDAYYELVIRNYLIDNGNTNVKILHNKAIKYTSAIAQSKVIKELLDSNYLKEDEIASYKRGRNNSTTGRKNVDPKTYIESTGFEALIGYLFLEKKDRLNDIINKSIEIAESEGF